MIAISPGPLITLSVGLYDCIPCRGVRPPQKIWHKTASDVKLQFWRPWESGIHLHCHYSQVPQILKSGVVAHVRVLSMGQIDLFKNHQNLIVPCTETS